MSDNQIQINRAPVLTLWAAVVAERLGFAHDEALSLGKAVSGLTAQTKGRRLGIFHPAPKTRREASERTAGETFAVELCGRAVPAVNTSEGVRALAKDRPVAPPSVERYLAGKFGEALPQVREAMSELAKANSVDRLASEAFSLYERFRPSIPAGVTGWGAKGELNLGRIRRLAKRA